MPRRARQESKTGVYHVMVRGLNKLSVFAQKGEKTRIVNLINEKQDEYDVEIYAYCIMPNHFHLLLKSALDELASFMAKVLASYAHYYNYKHDRIGYVFQDRYKSQCVLSEGYLWNCLRYIHLNPVKAKLCENMEDYKHSSAGEFYCGIQQVIHKKIFEMCQERFQSLDAFWEFHHYPNGECKEVFIDLKDDEFLQKKEIAEEILYEMQRDTEIPREELLNIAKMRALFDETLMIVFQISKKEAFEIRKAIEIKKGTG